MPPFEQGHEKLASGCIKVLPRQIGEQLGSVITAPRWRVRLSQWITVWRLYGGDGVFAFVSVQSAFLCLVWHRASGLLSSFSRLRQIEMEANFQCESIAPASVSPPAPPHTGPPGSARAPFPSLLLKTGGIFAPIKKNYAISLPPTKPGRWAWTRWCRPPPSLPPNQFSIILIPLTIIAIKHSS